jgi:two-component system sensor histidine kinase/response regulator
MLHKLSLRQYKRHLGIQGEQQLDVLLDEFEALDESSNLSSQAKTALRGMRQYLSQVDEAYEQADRDLALGKRSLELSSDELYQANETLRQEAGMRQHVMLTLRRTANEVLSQLGKHLDDEDSLEDLSHLLSGLVTELLHTRAELEQALVGIENRQFALDQHAIVSITDADGKLIYANDKFCDISQYSREELLGARHVIVNAALHGQEFFDTVWRTVTEGKVWHGEIKNKAKDQSLYWTSATFVPFFDEQHRPYQFICIRTDITEQKLLKEEIESSKLLLQNVMNTLGEGVYTLDVHGRCTFVNPEAEKILGWSNNELTGKFLHDVIHSIRFDGSHLVRHECDITQSMDAGRVFRSDQEYFQHKSGRVFPVSIVASPIFENGKIVGSVAAFQDITARNLADNALRESENKQRMLLDNAADAVFVAGKDERWVYINDLALAMLGYTRDELIGASIYELLPTERREAARDDLLSQLNLHKFFRSEIRLLRKNGERVPVEMNTALLPDGSIYGSCRDITKRKVFEAALIKAKEGAESASRAKSEFLATMSHEIRTPMNGIIGMAELALDTKLEPEQREYLELLQVSSHSLLAIINDILDFSKIESGKLVMEKIEFPLRELMASTLKALSLRSDQKGIELVYKIDPVLPVMLIGDPGRLRQVITNLVGNAIKFSERGTIVLDIQLAHRLGQEVQIYFSVTDHGIGIALDKQNAIFESFSQADTSTTRKYGGTGLGLSISSRLVLGMQGILQVNSIVGKGSTFYFTGSFGVGAERPAIETSVELTGLSVLVVDDNAINRHFFSDTLKNWGMFPQSAEGGREALELIFANEANIHNFDLILLDGCMPEMDGFELASQLQKIDAVSKAKMLMLSSAGSYDDAQRCKDLGIAGYVKKPISQQELRLAIAAALSGNSDYRTHHIELHASPISSPVHRLKILVAEDNLINQKLALSLLHKWGHSAEVAVNGFAAVEMFKSGQYDLILMDMQMPEMGGIEATQQLRQLEGGLAHIPIIAMTANALAGDRERCLAAGMDHYLAKPIKAEKLRDLLALYVGKAEQEPDTQFAELVHAPTRRMSDRADSVFDYSVALLPADQEILQIIAPLFIDDCARQLKEISDAVFKRDGELLCLSAHNLKGLVVNFNATPVEELANELEKKGKADEFERAKFIFSELNYQVELLLVALRKFVSDFIS